MNAIKGIKKFKSPKKISQLGYEKNNLKDILLVPTIGFKKLNGRLIFQGPSYLVLRMAILLYF